MMNCICIYICIYVPVTLQDVTLPIQTTSCRETGVQESAHIHICIHVCIYICLYAYMHIYIYICVYACVCVCVCIYIYATPPPGLSTNFGGRRGLDQMVRLAGHGAEHGHPGYLPFLGFFGGKNRNGPLPGLRRIPAD